MRELEADPTILAGPLDLQGPEALLDGGAGVELTVDDGKALVQVGVLFEPEAPGRGLVFEVADVDLG